MSLAVQRLTIKSVQLVWRSPSLRTLAWLSSVIVFLTLYLMWFNSRNQRLHFLTDSSYQKLSFDVICTPGLKYQPGYAKCKPTGQRDDVSAGALSPADILIQIITTGTIMSDSNDPQGTHDFAGLLSSIMMNGAPLMGIDDYTYLSDFVNEKLGNVGREQIMNYTAYRYALSLNPTPRPPTATVLLLLLLPFYLISFAPIYPDFSDKFGNFLDVRKRELRVAPYNCWTGRFLTHLYHHTAVAKDLNIVQYGSMSDAMKDSTDNVWAILEIVGPPGGLDCSFFADDSDSVQYRDSPPDEGVGSTAARSSAGAGSSAKGSGGSAGAAVRNRRQLINSNTSSDSGSSSSDSGSGSSDSGSSSSTDSGSSGSSSSIISDSGSESSSSDSSSSSTVPSVVTDDTSVESHDQSGLLEDKDKDKDADSSMNTIAMQATLSRSGPLITVRMQPSGASLPSLLPSLPSLLPSLLSSLFSHSPPLSPSLPLPIHTTPLTALSPPIPSSCVHPHYRCSDPRHSQHRVESTHKLRLIPPAIRTTAVLPLRLSHAAVGNTEFLSVDRVRGACDTNPGVGRAPTAV